ncbi:hypothetical protein PbB2_02666 [Candidatus Phycosocius bacilliformis]|uniref:Uncharacterized protein n=1 Tax=Candidatus Phycosocius bacilliformis TaxID=1445552 RepID=A0A2P2ED41_9PROT|nr:hypothetical protein PbB2_02666 [Candidatus Phycosocius bacilliformis]
MPLKLTQDTQVQPISRIAVTLDPKRRPPRLWELIRPQETNRMSSPSHADLVVLEHELRHHCQQSNWGSATKVWHQLVIAKHKLAMIGDLA